MMLRKILTGLCLLGAFFCVQPALAETKLAVDPREDPNTYYSEMAKSIKAHQIDAHSFDIRSTKETTDTFGKDQINISYDNDAPANADEQAIKDVVYGYNQTTLSSLFSGVFQIYPQKNFASDGIYQEANARNLYELFNKPGAGENVGSYDFSLDVQQLQIDGDYAKVVVVRHADVTYTDSEEVSNVSYGGTEGYLLQKVEGRWKIANVLFVTNFFTDTFRDFEQAKDKNAWQAFTFENCQRKDYEATENFKDYIQGDITNPVVKLDLMNITYRAEEEAATADSKEKATETTTKRFSNYPATAVRVVWDGKEIIFPDQQPIAISGTTFAPSRPLVAAMPGDYMVNVVKDKPWYAVSIQPAPDSASAKENNYYLAFHQGHDNEAPFYTVDYGANGVMDQSKHQEVQMDAQIQIMGDRLMLPVRALVEPFADISWDKDTKTVIITSK